MSELFHEVLPETFYLISQLALIKEWTPHYRLPGNLANHAMEKGNYKVRFGISNAKMKVFRFAKLDDNLYPVDVANEPLEAIKVDGPMESDEPPTRADHAESSADKSAALRVYRS